MTSSYPHSFFQEHGPVRPRDTVDQVADILTFVAEAVGDRTTEPNFSLRCYTGLSFLCDVLSDTLHHASDVQAAAEPDDDAERAEGEGYRRGFAEGQASMRSEIDALRRAAPAETYPRVGGPARGTPVTITRAGVVMIEGRAFTAPELKGRIGQRVRFEFTSAARDRVRVYDERGELLCVAPPEDAPPRAEAC